MYNRAAVVVVLVVVVVVVVVVVAVVYNSFPARNFSLEFLDKLSQCMIAYKSLTVSIFGNSSKNCILGMLLACRIELPDLSCIV